MGALHAGHLALIAAARAAGATRVVASVFVNPTQFGPTEDFDRYPRDEAADAAALTAARCRPAVRARRRRDLPGRATRRRCASRGSATSSTARRGPAISTASRRWSTKLLLAAAPDVAVFGEKDWQQLAIIRRLVADLALPVEIVGAPIVRDADGLALSSRNAYLTADERRARGRLAARARGGARRRSRAALPVAAALAAAVGGARRGRVRRPRLCRAGRRRPRAAGGRSTGRGGCSRRRGSARRG